MEKQNFFNDQELEELLLVFAMTINVDYGFDSEYDLSRLYIPNFFEEKIKNLNISQDRALKEICKKILYFLERIQYNYFDINQTQQKDIDLFNHVIRLLDKKEKEEREMNTPLRLLVEMKKVNNSMKKKPLIYILLHIYTIRN